MDVPESIDQSFYSGKVVVTLKDAIFEPSSPLRHAAELVKVLKAAQVNTILRPILFLYSDGGPDHRVTYVSVQASLICLFLHLQLDFLVTARTAPMQSFRNPVERCMSLLNLGLQSVGMMRSSMTGELEGKLKQLSKLLLFKMVSGSLCVNPSTC